MGANARPLKIWAHYRAEAISLEIWLGPRRTVLGGALSQEVVLDLPEGAVVW